MSSTNQYNFACIVISYEKCYDICYLYSSFPDWRGIVQREKFADAVFICTPDRQHKVIVVEHTCYSINQIWYITESEQPFQQN